MTNIEKWREALKAWNAYEKEVIEYIKTILKKYNHLVYKIIDWKNKQIKWEKWWDVDVKVIIRIDDSRDISIPIQIKKKRKWDNKIKSYEKKWISIIDWKTWEELSYFITLLFIQYLSEYNKSLWTI